MHSGKVMTIEKKIVQVRCTVLQTMEDIWAESCRVRKYM